MVLAKLLTLSLSITNILCLMSCHATTKDVYIYALKQKQVVHDVLNKSFLVDEKGLALLLKDHLANDLFSIFFVRKMDKMAAHSCKCRTNTDEATAEIFAD